MPTDKRLQRRQSMTGRFRQVIDTVAEQHQQREREGGHVRRRIRWLLWVARVALQLTRQWVRDRCPQQASSLAFQTSMSLVPLIAIGLMVLRGTGAFDRESDFVEYISRQVIPVSAEEISRQLVTWAGHLSFKTAGIMGISMTLVLSYVMFNSVERIFNDIWRVERRRTFWQKFVIFYVVATITPALLGLSLYHAARYGLDRGFVGFLGGVGATWGALFFANKLLPATRVKWSAAALGSLLSAVGFEIAKVLFQLYVSEIAFRKFSGVYGALGLIPILFLWIYYSWLVILFGAEVAHAGQHLGQLERSERHARDPERYSKVNGVVAARVLCEIASAWRAGGPPLGREALADKLDLNDDAIERVVRRLVDGGLLIEGETGALVPARPPADITLADVLAIFRPEARLAPPSPPGAAGQAPPAAAHAPATRLDQVLAEIDGETRERAGAVSFEELSSDPVSPGPLDPSERPTVSTS